MTSSATSRLRLDFHHIKVDFKNLKSFNPILLCHHWIVLCMLITVWFSSATKSALRRLRRVSGQLSESLVQPPHSPRTALIQSEQKSWKHHSGPFTFSTLLFKLLLSGRRYRALSTRTTRHRTSSSLRQSSHEHLTLNMKHTTLLFI